MIVVFKKILNSSFKRIVMKRLKYVLALCCIMFNAQAFSEMKLKTGKIVQIMILPSTYDIYDSNSESYTMLYVEGLDKACLKEDGIARVSIGSKHAAHDAVLALALSAHATGNDVKIAYLNSCTLKSNSWDFSHMFLTENL